MSNSGKFFNVTNLTIGVLGLLAAVVGAGIAFVQGWPPVLFGKKDHFFCELRPDTQRGGEVWTVMYRHDKGVQPWLKMVTTLGGGYTPIRRCEIISERLETYRKDGLTQLGYRGDSNTPDQYVICAKTKLSGDNCPLLVTLKPGTQRSAYKSLQDITEDLRNGTGVYQGSEGKLANSNFSPASPVIDLTPFLAEEDRIAGSNSAK
ncbi:COP23 domain-containing protein [Microcoleus sp. CAWBG640]|uniref:COP23 domain-containing protein n=1 Tax=Microcoleus sp. CAWBG640 TaxID=2841653 RepID=UPI00312BC219